MRVRASVQIIGLECPSTFEGSSVTVTPATFKLATTGGPVDRTGTAVSIDGRTTWKRAQGACTLAELVISAAIDLRTMLLTRANYEVTVGRTTCPAPVVEYPWRSYELLNWVASKELLPYTVRLTPSGVTRLGELIEAALARDASDLWDVADGLAAVERAAQGTSAGERVVDLWTGLEALIPAPPRKGKDEAVAAWLADADRTTPGFAARFVTLLSDDVKAIIAARARLAALPGVQPGLAGRLRGRCRSRSERISIVVAGVYAIRNAVVHGSISARTTRDLEAIRAADAIAWAILDSRVAQLLEGKPPMLERYRDQVAAGL